VATTLPVATTLRRRPRACAASSTQRQVLLDLAADIIELSGVSRDAPIEFEGVREGYLSETVARSRAQHENSTNALRAAAMLRAGVDPGLVDEVSWWRSDDLRTGRWRPSSSTYRQLPTASLIPSTRSVDDSPKFTTSPSTTPNDCRRRPVRSSRDRSSPTMQVTSLDRTIEPSDTAVIGSPRRTTTDRLMHAESGRIARPPARGRSRRRSPSSVR
jgi:hypothetical protein